MFTLALPFSELPWLEERKRWVYRISPNLPAPLVHWVGWQIAAALWMSAQPFLHPHNMVRIVRGRTTLKFAFPLSFKQCDRWLSSMAKVNILNPIWTEITTRTIIQTANDISRVTEGTLSFFIITPASSNEVILGMFVLPHEVIEFRCVLLMMMGATKAVESIFSIFVRASRIHTSFIICYGCVCVW